MSTYRKVDPSTLGWVKGEIDETLKQARVALEGFIENPSDRGRLRFCVTHLHQVVGTLLMVELDGAAFVAREVEALAEAVLDEQAEASPEVLETLTRGILALPDYLGRLQYGHPDLPLRYLALLNELRGARNAAPVAELELFQPDLSVRPPAAAAGFERLADADYAALARTLRATYQGALLNWLRDSSNPEPLSVIGEALEELRQRAAATFLQQLFWAAGGLVEGLSTGALAATPERKKHLARLDQQIKKVVDGTERSVLRSSCEALVRAVLYDLAQARDALTPRIAELKQAFRLAELVAPVEAEDAGAPVPASPEVLQTVAQALDKELEQAQDVLAAAFDSGKIDADSLAPLSELLHRMSATLDMAGLPVLRELVDEIAEVVAALGEGRLDDAPAAAMPLAQALLVVEGGVRALPRPSEHWRRQAEQTAERLRVLRAGDEMPSAHGIEVSDAALTEGEYQQLLGVVAGEIGVNLGRIEEALEGFAAHRDQPERLEAVPGQLEQIKGALQILGADRAVELAAVTRRQVEDVRSGASVADAALLDGLAVCIGTLGAYVDGLKAGRRDIDSLVDGALRELERAGRAAPGAEPSVDDPVGVLRQRLDAWMATPAAAGPRTALRAQLSAFAGVEHGKVALIAGELERLIDLVADDPASLSEEVRNTLRASCDALAAELPSAETPPVRPAARASHDTAPAVPPSGATAPGAPETPAEDDFDEEIRQIFIEDARDVLENIGRECERWRNDTDNRDALAEVRRGYHTLKGSGRMVGASEIAELAWAVEHMLNYVRDGKLEPEAEVFEILEQSQAVLPDMIAQLEGGPMPEFDAERLAARAHALVEGRSAAPARPGMLPRLDGTLLEIFTNEARGHLATIRAQIDACRDAGSRSPVTPALTRAIHTLQGNARSLGIGMMAEACAEAEHLLHTLQAQHLPLVPAHLALLDRFAAAVNDVVEAVAVGVTEVEGLLERFGEITAGLVAEGDAYAAPESAKAASAPERPPEPAGVAPAPAQPAAAPEQPHVPAAADAFEGANEAPFEEMAVDPELLEIFREEAADILNQVEQVLRAWRAEPESQDAVLELKRALHTLKGGARMAGAMRMGHLSHQTESLVIQTEAGAVSPSPALFDLLDEAHDALVSMLDGIEEGAGPAHLDALIARLVSMAEGAYARPPDAVSEAPLAPPLTAAAGDAPEPQQELPPDVQAPLPAPPQAEAAPVPPLAEPADPPAPLPEGPAAPEPAPSAAPEAARPDGEAWPDRRERPGQIRVNTNLLNNLVNYAGEVSISRSRMEQQIYGFRDNLAELKRSAARFREQLRELEIQSEAQILYRLDQQDPASNEFDPLEFDRYTRLQTLARSLTESLHDLTTIQLNLGNYVGEAEAVLQQQARLNTELQEGLMRTRMVEFSTQAARLRHIVRQTARELGKRAELDVIGGEVQIDRTVLERMIGPFEHMIRNSLDHGIEAEAERARAGKPPVGGIEIAAHQEGNEIVIRFSDDGAGMNVERIRAKALERGLIAPDANLGEDELLQFVLISGFSTASAITHVSGRGVGMDVVHSEVKQLGGSMAVDTKAGGGTSWIIRLPLTLSITQALMVYVGEQVFAVPIGSVANIIECTQEQLSRVAVGKNPLLSHDDKLYSFMSLASRLGIAPAARGSRKVPVLLARSGNREVAIQVDGLGGTREIVIKTLGRQLAELKGIAGATIMGDGRVVLILDIPGLWYADEALHVEHHPHRPAAPAAEARERPVVMVVDDSLTVRKVTGKHLQRRGYDVMVAKDGLDAVEQLRARVPDLMLVDIEMPRMDGYELTGRVRADAGLRHIPIVMITSRAGEKHRQRGLELGVDVYMTKPYQEDELFATIDRLLGRGR